jgi:shikimate kinase
MGVGKSEVAKILADKLGMSYVDIDDKIEKTARKTITAIFEEEGEDAFRQLERSVTREIAAKEGQVIACGGGTVLNDENLNNLRKTSVLILLKAEPEAILDRVKATGDSRPLLNVADRLKRIRELLSFRNPRYMKSADIMIDTSYLKPEQVAEEIVRQLGEKGD